MKYRAIIKESWALTQENKRLIWWFAVLPAMLTTLVSVVYLAYQVMAFWSSPEIRKAAEGTEDAFTMIIKGSLSFVSSHPGVGTFLIVRVTIVGILYIMLPGFTQGAPIELVARIRRGRKVSMAEGISYGLKAFLPLVECQLMSMSCSW